MAIDLFGFTLFNPTCRLTNLSQYPLHDHIHRFFRRQPVRHKRFHLFLVHAPDSRLVRHFRERVAHLDNGDRLCHGTVFNDLHAVNMPARACRIALGYAPDLRRGIVFERDRRLDEPPRALARKDDLLLYPNIVRGMTENVRRKLRHRVLACNDRVINSELTDPAVHEREVREISAVPAYVHDQLRNDFDAAIWSVIVYFRIHHLRALADLNDSVHDVTNLLRLRKQTVRYELGRRILFKLHAHLDLLRS